MTDERIEEVLFEVSGKLSSIETKLDSLSETILKHEARITNLENKLNNMPKPQDSFKEKMLELLGRCLIISITIIGSLCGAGSIISKMCGLN